MKLSMMSQRKVARRTEECGRGHVEVGVEGGGVGSGGWSLLTYQSGRTTVSGATGSSLADM